MPPISADQASVRRATEADIEALQNLERACFGETVTTAAYRSALQVEGTLMWLAELADLPVGFAAVQLVVDEAHLTNLGVLAEYRRQGVASLLLATVLAMAAECGARTMYLEVRRRNGAAQQLYGRHGFRAVGSRRDYYWDPLDDAVIMRLSLAAWQARAGGAANRPEGTTD